MNNTRLMKLIVAPALILAAIVTLQAFGPSSDAQESSRISAGMGDLHRYEAQQIIPDIGAQEGSRPYVGMGDLRRYEALLTIPDIGAQAGSQPYAGMGDLHRFEALQEIQIASVSR